MKDWTDFHTCYLCGVRTNNKERHYKRSHNVDIPLFKFSGFVAADARRTSPAGPSTDGRDGPGHTPRWQDHPGQEVHMEQATRDWLAYTDNVLVVGDKAATEIALIMSVMRGPDYVRTAAVEGAAISPKSEDRQPVKLVTTAVLRALAFPKTAASLAKGGKFVAQLQKDFGVSQAKAEAVAALLNGEVAKTPNWQVNVGKPGYGTPFSVYNNAEHGAVCKALAQIGSASHFGIKVKKAAALFGYSL